jgi:hypothetical protein
VPAGTSDPPLLPYAADLPTRYGIAYEVTGPRARLVVPNSTLLRYRLAEFWTTPEGRGLGLHIHISGRTVLEVIPGHPPEVARWVAERLSEALATTG